jgi:hypothetical protein
MKKNASSKAAKQTVAKRKPDGTAKQKAARPREGGGSGGGGEGMVF